VAKAKRRRAESYRNEESGKSLRISRFFTYVFLELTRRINFYLNRE